MKAIELFILERKSILTVVILIWVIFLVSLNLFDRNTVFSALNVPTMTPEFADLRVLTHGAESFKKGFDPLVEHPSDPWNRRLNYPRIWHQLFSLGVNSSHTLFFAMMLLILFSVGLVLLFKHLDFSLSCLMFCAVSSPAVVLGFERGNIDLLMFFITCLIAFLYEKSKALAWLAMILGFVLKLFPIFSFIVFVEEKKTFYKYLFITLVFIGIYIILTYSDLQLIRAATPSGKFISYGISVPELLSRDSYSGFASIIQVFSYLSVLLIVVFSFWFYLSNKKLNYEDGVTDEIIFNAFRLGSGIYLGTFMIGSNYDYRLMFLILVIPQLYFWVKKRLGLLSNIASLCLVMIFISMWHLFLLKQHFLPLLYLHGFNQIAKWITFFGLCFLLINTCPNWFKSFFKRESN